VSHAKCYRLSQCERVDLDSLRPESLLAARKDLQSFATLRPVHLDIWPNRSPILADGRHRVTEGLREGIQALPAIVTEYTVTGRRKRERAANAWLVLDDWP
jgi:hypothetical protein